MIQQIATQSVSMNVTSAKIITQMIKPTEMVEA